MPKTYDNYYGTSRPKGSFLASEEGLKLETMDFTSVANSLGVEETNAFGKTEKVIKAGTIYPSNGSTATGIVFQDCHPDAEGHYVGSLMTGGYVYEERLEGTPASAAITTLKALGLYVIKAPVMKRPDFGSGELTKLATPVVTMTSGTASWSEIPNAQSYAVYKNNELVGVTTNLSQAVSGVSGDKVKVQAQGDYVNYKNSDFGEANWA